MALATVDLYALSRPVQEGVIQMPDAVTLIELDERIAIARQNLSELIEQAAAFSGGADEERAAERIAEQQALLDNLIRQREALAE